MSLNKFLYSLCTFYITSYLLIFFANAEDKAKVIAGKPRYTSDGGSLGAFDRAGVVENLAQRARGRGGGRSGSIGGGLAAVGKGGRGESTYGIGGIKTRGRGGGGGVKGAGPGSLGGKLDVRVDVSGDTKESFHNAKNVSRQSRNRRGGVAVGRKNKKDVNRSGLLGAFAKGDQRDSLRDAFDGMDAIENLAPQAKSRSDRTRGSGEGERKFFKGVIDKEAVRRVIRRNVHQLRTCYERLAQKNPNASGRVDLNWTIEANGRVGSVKVVRSQIRDKRTLDCMKLHLAGWKFPDPPEGIIGDINYPFVFVISRQETAPQQTVNKSRLITEIFRVYQNNQYKFTINCFGKGRCENDKGNNVKCLKYSGGSECRLYDENQNIIMNVKCDSFGDCKPKA